MNALPQIERPSDSALFNDGDLRRYISVIWRWKWVVLLWLLVLPIGTYLIASRAQKTYDATVILSVQPASVDTSLLLANAAPSAVPGQSLAAAAATVTTSAVLDGAARRLNPAANPHELLAKVSVTADTSSGFLSITASDASPKRATAIADAMGASVVRVLADQARTQIDSAVTHVAQDLRRLPATDVTERSQLSDQLQRLRALSAAQDYNAQVIQPASVPTSPSSPRPARDAVLALVVGLFVGLGSALLLDRLDRRIREPSELEQLSGGPLLGVVPESAFPKRGASAAAHEAFQTLRSTLLYFNVDRPLHSVIIASPLPEEGKTTVATGVAEALAASGKTVVLVDTDLRYSHGDSRMGGDVEHGLGSLLAGQTSLEDVLIDDGPLRILPSGPQPPNPSQLVGSDRMRRLLVELSDRFDMIVIDTPAGLVVGDAIPLLQEASGVVLVGRVSFSRRDAFRRFATVVRNANGTLLGTVATGTRNRQGAGYYGHYRYAKGGKPRWPWARGARGSNKVHDEGTSNGGVPVGPPTRTRA
jgi:succinoglycan biosynthesis transport protein ExoP